MLTIESVAASLDGREYGSEVRGAERVAWRDAGIVVAYGASDDLLELDGAIDKEINALNGAQVLVHAGGIADEDEIRETHGDSGWTACRKALTALVAAWCPPDVDGSPSWVVSIAHPLGNAIPSATFRVYEDGELFGIGLVFSIRDLPALPLAD